MEQWDKDYIDMVEPGYIEFGSDGLGELKFGCISATVDWEIEYVGNTEKVAFSFEGLDEGDQISGRGWATSSKSHMEGRIFIHLGDDSNFIARKDEGQ